MKKTILSLLLVSFVFVAFAQKSEISLAKNNYALYEVSRAKSSLSKQLEALNLAKESTEKAILYKKTEADPELWAYRALIYSTIALVDTVKRANSDAAFKTAQESIEKAKAFDTKGEQVQIIANAGQNLSIIMQKRGIAAFNKKDYKEAYNSFKFIADVMPQDSIFSMYTAMAAKNAELYDESIKYYRKTIEINQGNAGLYQELERVYISKSDTASALKVLEEGLAKHPTSMGLIFDELNIYLNKGEAAKQIAKIENAISKEPKNKTLRFVAGVAYSANKDFDKAEASYKKALELDPNYADAVYNLAVININRGNDYITAANKLPTNKASDAKYNDLKKKFENELSKAMPLLEKAKELNPKDPNVLSTLREVYIKLNQLDKAAAIKKQLSQL